MRCQPGRLPPSRAQDGQTMVEYAVVLAVITGAIIVSIGLLSTTSQNMMTIIISYL